MIKASKDFLLFSIKNRQNLKLYTISSLNAKNNGPDSDLNEKPEFK